MLNFNEASKIFKWYRYVYFLLLLLLVPHIDTVHEVQRLIILIPLGSLILLNKLDNNMHKYISINIYIYPKVIIYRYLLAYWKTY
jgi:hypothetical protein